MVLLITWLSKQPDFLFHLERKKNLLLNDKSKLYSASILSNYSNGPLLSKIGPSVKNLILQDCNFSDKIPDNPDKRLCEKKK